MITRFKVVRKGTTEPVFNAWAPDKIVEITVVNGVFSAVPGDYVIETAPGRILIVPARFFDRAWEYADKAKKTTKIAPEPEPAAVEEVEEELPQPLEDEPTPETVPTPDKDLWALTAKQLAEMAVGYQINTKPLRSKKQLIDAIKAAERG